MENLRRQAEIFILEKRNILVYWRVCRIGNPEAGVLI